MAITDATIAELRRMIRSGELPPGTRLPPEDQLATRFGISRGGLREAVKVLAAAHVLVVRRGDGTYVTALEPRGLLSGVGQAVELLRGDALRQVQEVRRLLEPAATALAARRITDRQLLVVAGALHDMRDPGLLPRAHVAFHRAVNSAAGNEALSTLLDGLSRGAPAAGEHEAIYKALRARDPALAQAAALLHFSARLPQTPAVSLP